MLRDGLPGARGRKVAWAWASYSRDEPAVCAADDFLSVVSEAKCGAWYYTILSYIITVYIMQDPPTHPHTRLHSFMQDWRKI